MFLFPAWAMFQVNRRRLRREVHFVFEDEDLETGWGAT
jgi:hypothetical protein